MNESKMCVNSAPVIFVSRLLAYEVSGMADETDLHLIVSLNTQSTPKAVEDELDEVLWGSLTNHIRELPITCVFYPRLTGTTNVEFSQILFPNTVVLGAEATR